MGFRLKKDSNGMLWQKHINDEKRDELKKVKKFCRKHFLKYGFIDDSMERSTDYRRRFFKEQRGVFGTKIYICAYCGRFLTKKNVRVDHIIPVYKAANSGFYRTLLSLRRIKNVNDVRNLTASCEKCNSRKSAKGGLWVIRGWFGRSPVRIIIKEILLLLLGSTALYYLYIFIKENIYDSFIFKITEYFY